MKPNVYIYPFLACILSFSNLYSQNQQNKIDTTGNIGVGTLNPSHKLEVNGRARIDSTLEVRDSAVFDRKVRIKEDVIIHGKTFLRDHGVANQNFRVQNGFRVDGISRFYDNVFVDSTFRVETLGLFNGNLRVNGQLRSYGVNNLFGVSRFHDQVRLINLNDTSGQNQDGFMMLSGNGLVKRIDVEEVDSVSQGQNILVLDENGIPKGIAPDAFLNINEPCLQLDFAPVGAPPSSPTPIWANKPGVLWTGDPCPAKVGIGTNDPHARLDVRGVTQTSKLYIKSGLPDHAPNHPQFAIMEIEAHNEDIFQVYTNGLVRAREIKVNQNVWPDYVFEDSYRLLDLYETEKFIKKNNRLPGLPSAEEVEKEGVALGEMNKVLLEKVEELTLHVIELQKQIDELKENKKGGE